MNTVIGASLNELHIDRASHIAGKLSTLYMWVACVAPMFPRTRLFNQ